jgi:hypothetical protein
MIKVAGLRLSTRREESDFYSLRKVLCRQFPYLLCPSLPFRSELKYTKKSIAKRVQLFQRFLKAILSSPEYRSSEMLVLFLNDQDNYRSKAVIDDQLYERV